MSHTIISHPSLCKFHFYFYHFHIVISWPPLFALWWSFNRPWLPLLQTSSPELCWSLIKTTSDLHSLVLSQISTKWANLLKVKSSTTNITYFVFCLVYIWPVICAPFVTSTLQSMHLAGKYHHWQMKLEKARNVFNLLQRLLLPTSPIIPITSLIDGVFKLIKLFWEN